MMLFHQQLTRSIILHQQGVLSVALKLINIHQLFIDLFQFSDYPDMSLGRFKSCDEGMVYYEGWYQECDGYATCIDREDEKRCIFYDGMFPVYFTNKSVHNYADIFSSRTDNNSSITIDMPSVTVGKKYNRGDRGELAPFFSVAPTDAMFKSRIT